MPEADLTGRQLELIATLAALDPPPWFVGGYAEGALLAGAATREHEDVGLIFQRFFPHVADDDLMPPSEPL